MNRTLATCDQANLAIGNACPKSVSKLARFMFPECTLLLPVPDVGSNVKGLLDMLSKFGDEEVSMEASPDLQLGHSFHEALKLGRRKNSNRLNKKGCNCTCSSCFSYISYIISDPEQDNILHNVTFKMCQPPRNWSCMSLRDC